MSRFNKKQSAIELSMNRIYTPMHTTVFDSERSAKVYGKTDRFQIKTVNRYGIEKTVVLKQPYDFLRRSQRKRRRVAKWN